MKRYIGFVLAAAVSMSANADWSKKYDVSYAMGDGDTRAVARQAAIEQIKLKASSEAGSYVQKDVLLANDNLTETIKVLSASLVKVNIKGESIKVGKDGNAVLAISAIASVDEKSLNDRIKALQSDKKLSEHVDALKAENFALRQELIELSKKRGEAASLAILKRKSVLLNKLDDNNKNMAQVFEQGTLLQMVQRDKDRQEELKTVLDDMVFQPLLDAKINAEIASIKEAENGKYHVYVKVDWNVDESSIKDGMGKAFGDDLKFPERWNRNGKIIHVDGLARYSKELLYGYVVTKQAVLELTIGGTTEYVYVAYPSSGGRNGCNFSPERYSDDGWDNSYCVKLKNPQPDLIVSFDISKRDAEMATGVKAEMFVKTVILPPRPQYRS